MSSAEPKPDEEPKPEELDMFGYFPCSQRPGAWMGAAYMFFNAVDKESANKDAEQPSSSSSDRARSRSRSLKSKRDSESNDKKK